MVDGSQLSWITPALEAGAEYRWSVSPMTNNTNGPSSGMQKFFVGSNCSEGPVPAPTILHPFNGATVIMQIPTLIWESATTCLADAYHIDIATDPAFNNILLNTNTDGPIQSYTLAAPLPTCTRYYWRVAAVEGAEIQTYSETYSFRISTEGCESEPGAGIIAGKVWNDICTLPEDGPIPDPLPYGCVMSGDGPVANGIVNPGEPGITDIVVRIGAGSCSASTPLGLTTTYQGGNYFFWGMQAGTYCISVDAAENPIWLGPGWWTYPPNAVGNSYATWEITLASEENKPDVNFGWQYENGLPNLYNYLGGVVYHDNCKVPHGVGYNDPLPDNCWQHAGWVTGDGNRAEGEPGIPGLQVEVHSPTCSDPISQVTTTDEDGHFAFMFQPAVVNCIIVRSQTSPNKEILQPGVWSYYPNQENYEIQFYYTALSLNNPDQFEIGWDYSKLPLLITPIEVPELYPQFKPDFDISCRAGPSTIWQAWAKLMKGMKFQIKAINPTRDWALLQPAELLNPNDFAGVSKFPADLRCWAALENGQTEGDLRELETLKGPSLPTPTPTAVPVSCTGLSADACGTTPGCKWIPLSTTPGYCTAK